MSRKLQIDLLKAYAIISVIIVHSVPRSFLVRIGAPFYIMQQVPVFMVLAGYNNVQSFVSRGISNIKDMYSYAELSRRMERLLRPWLPVFISQIILICVFEEYRGLISITTMGPGSYFPFLMIQAVLIFPVLYWLSRKSFPAMLVITFGLNMAFEVLCSTIEMPNELYRLIFLRYLFASALGIWYAQKEPGKFSLALGGIISGIYILAVDYIGIIFPTYQAWGSQHAPGFFWALILVVMAMRFFPSSSSDKAVKILARIGKSSYHIFVAQMVYFWNSPLSFRRWLVYSIPSVEVLRILIDMGFCILSGIILYEIDEKITKRFNPKEK